MNWQTYKINLMKERINLKWSIKRVKLMKLSMILLNNGWNLISKIKIFLIMRKLQIWKILISLLLVWMKIMMRKKIQPIDKGICKQTQKPICKPTH
jgi:hypothetical protein